MHIKYVGPCSSCLSPIEGTWAWTHVFYMHVFQNTFLQMEKSILEITLSGQWARNTRASWGCMPNQKWFCILLLFKWQGICTESTPGKCHAWSEFSAWGTCNSQWPKTYRYRVLPHCMRWRRPRVWIMLATRYTDIAVVEGCGSEEATCIDKRHHYIWMGGY